MRELLVLLLFGLQLEWTEGQTTSNIHVYPIPVPVNCIRLHGRVSWEDVMTCSRLVARYQIGMHVLPILGAIDLDKWDEFTSNLTVIWHVDLTIRNTTIRKIKLPKVKLIIGSWLTVENNPLLEEISINIEGRGNFSGLIISGNPKLKTIKITGAPRASVVFLQNATIKITGNAALTVFELPNNTVFYGAEALNVSYNAKLEKIVFKRIESFRGVVVDIRQNPRLRTIDVQNINELRKVFKGVFIKANRRLTRVELEKFKDFKQIDTRIFQIQKEGECIFEGQLQNLEELKGCKYVESDLWIRANAGGEATGVRLSRVTGRIHLASLGPEKLGFLKGANVDAGQISSEICNFELDTVPKYVNQNKCPMNVSNQSVLIWPLMFGLLTGFFGLLALIAVICSLYWFCWRNRQQRGTGRKRRRRPRRTGIPGALAQTGSSGAATATGSQPATPSQTKSATSGSGTTGTGSSGGSTTRSLVKSATGTSRIQSQTKSTTKTTSGQKSTTSRTGTGTGEKTKTAEIPPGKVKTEKNPRGPATKKNKETPKTKTKVALPPPSGAPEIPKKGSKGSKPTPLPLRSDRQ